ncbi:MAG: hypothetical protein GC159_09755 [Phycisphaera sp.]|nr:hypothetical protein [Phycisphaera sp.]
MHTTRRSILATLTAATAVTLLLGAAGCSTHFPYGRSIDRHNFESTPLLPVTLTLVDSVTHETLWSLDVPVGKMAVVDLEHKHDNTAQQTAAEPAYKMRWAVLDTGTTFADLPNTLELPGNPVLLKMTHRAPESVAKKGA